VECLRVVPEADGAAHAWQVEVLNAGGGVGVIRSRHWASAYLMQKNDRKPTAADGYWWRHEAESKQTSYPKMRVQGWKLAGFEIGWMTEAMTPLRATKHVWVVFPVWVVVGMCMLMPGVAGWRWVQRLRARRREKRGLCGGCGYDLRGSASARCPECGLIAHA